MIDNYSVHVLQGSCTSGAKFCDTLFAQSVLLCVTIIVHLYIYICVYVVPGSIYLTKCFYNTPCSVG